MLRRALLGTHSSAVVLSGSAAERGENRRNRTSPRRRKNAPTVRALASDARPSRAAGVFAAVRDLTPHRLGGPDGYVEIDE